MNKVKAYDKSKRDSTNLQDQTFDTSKNGRALGNMNSLHSHGDQEHWLGYDYGLLDVFFLLTKLGKRQERL